MKASIQIIIPFLLIFLWPTTSPCQSAQNKLLNRWEFSSDELNSSQSPYANLEGVTYYHFTYLSNGKKINGFFATPGGETPKPTILWNDGGSAKYFPFTPNQVPRKFGRLLEEGFVVVACNYKDEANSEVKDEFGGEDVEHVVNLIDLLPSFSEIDTSAVGMYGWSRGGMMSYMTLVRTDKIKAMVVGGASSDLFLNGENRPEMELYVYADLMPDYKISRTAALNRRSAVKWADRFPKDVPILILHGTSDWRVRAENSLSLAMELSKNRVPYRLILYEGGDHGISEYREERQNEAIKWFNRFLVKKEPLPNMEYHGR